MCDVRITDFSPVALPFPTVFEKPMLSDENLGRSPSQIMIEQRDGKGSFPLFRRRTGFVENSLFSEFQYWTNHANFSRARRAPLTWIAGCVTCPKATFVDLDIVLHLSEFRPARERPEMGLRRKDEAAL